MKKSILISIIVGLVIILGAVGAYFFFRSAPVTTTPVVTTTGSPFGSGSGYNVTGTNASTTPAGTSVVGSGGQLPKLIELSAAPVAGAVSLLKNNTEVIRYVNRADGHIYDINPATLEKTEIVNTTLPKIYEAIFTPDGSKVIFRSLTEDSDTVTNLSIALTPPKPPIVAKTATTTIATTTPEDLLYTTATTPVRGTLGDMLATPDGRLAYVSYDQKAVALSNFDGTKGVSVFSSAFTDWRLSGVSKASVFLTTKAAAGEDGFTYSVPRAGGALAKVLGPLPGLITDLSPDGSRLAYSTSDGSNTTLTSIILSTGVSEALSPATLAEKCVWSIKQTNMLYCAAPTNGVGAGEPDLWYQGKAHFADRLWKLDTDSGSAVLLASPSIDFKIDIDAENLVLSVDEDYLIFMNKTDLTLWALKLD